MKLHYKLFIFSILLLSFFSSCTKIYEPRIVGKWEQPAELNPEGYNYTIAWEFNENDSIIVYNEPGTGIKNNIVYGRYTILSKKSKPYVKIETGYSFIDGFYYIEKLNKEKFILLRRYFLDNSTSATFLRKEFVKTKE